MVRILAVLVDDVDVGVLYHSLLLLLSHIVIGTRCLNGPKPSIFHFLTSFDHAPSSARWHHRVDLGVVPRLGRGRLVGACLHCRVGPLGLLREESFVVPFVVLSVVESMVFVLLGYHGGGSNCSDTSCVGGVAVLPFHWLHN